MKRLLNMVCVDDPRKAVWLGALLVLTMLQLSGCTVGPKYHPPVVEVPPAYKGAGNWKPAQPNDQSLGRLCKIRSLHQMAA